MQEIFSPVSIFVPNKMKMSKDWYKESNEVKHMRCFDGLAGIVHSYSEETLKL